MENSETVICYSIRYVETDGIVKREAIIKDIDGNTYATNCRTGWNQLVFLERVGKDIFLNEEEAIAAGKVKLERAIHSIEKRKKRILNRIAGLGRGPEYQLV